MSIREVTEKEAIAKRAIDAHYAQVRFHLYICFRLLYSFVLTLIIFVLCSSCLCCFVQVVVAAQTAAQQIRQRDLLVVEQQHKLKQASFESECFNVRTHESCLRSLATHARDARQLSDLNVHMRWNRVGDLSIS